MFINLMTEVHINLEDDLISCLLEYYNENLSSYKLFKSASLSF